MEVTKLESACRLIDTAIKLFFDEHDIVSVHCLAATGANVLNDVAMVKEGKSWRQYVQNDNNISKKDVSTAFNSAWNFFKHANRDVDSTLNIETLDTEWFLFLATLDAGDLGVKTKSMEVFQAWFLFEHPQFVTKDIPLVNEAKHFFENTYQTNSISSRLKARELLNDFAHI